MQFDIRSSIAYVTHPTVTKEKAFLVAVTSSPRDRNTWSVAASLEELAQLAATAGVEVVGIMKQRLHRPSSRFYLGEGKLQELVEKKKLVDYNVAIFDDELTPLQQRNLEEALGVKIIDRTALILDIFARHARTREGQLQVELAQHQYLLPRLAGQWSHLERLGGGIGTRGPGESQLETDRRLIRRRIHPLQQHLEEVRRHRSLSRRQRQRQGIPVVSMVGYTNVGKSTLMNKLCGTDILVEDKLFSTLDPTVRRLTLPNKQEILLTDTVGFIQKLPTTLIAAFRATLEELELASLLLHVADATHKYREQQCQVVEQTLNELGLGHKPSLMVYNKIDLLLPGELRDFPAGTIAVSAVTGYGLYKLLEAIAAALAKGAALMSSGSTGGRPARA